MASPPTAADPTCPDPRPGRRRFLGQGLALASASVASGVHAERGVDASAPGAAHVPTTQPASSTALATDVPPWGQQPGLPFQPYGQPSPHEARVLRRIGLNHRGISLGNGGAWTPLEQLEGTLTPNGLHFVRSHNGTPEIDPARHRLLLHGLVQRPLQFDLAALLRYPLQSRQLFLECAGNSSAGWFEEPVQRSAGLTHGLLSCSEWTGVPLRLLLAEAGVDPRARWVVASGADAGALHMSLPLDKALDDCLLALYQNGERLHPENGYPLRLIVPGGKGVLSVKWLQRLRLSEQPAMSRNETARYTELLPSGQARQFTLLMDTKSLITQPSHGLRLDGPGVHELRGLAWSGHGAIARVEVSTDGGAHWADASLQGPVLPQCLTRFRWPWQWDGRPAVLQSRATDARGHVQPTRAALVAERGRQGFYHYNAIVSWEVDEAGIVSHTYA